MAWPEEDMKELGRRFELERVPSRDQELLAAINTKLGYANSLLEKIHYWLQFIGGGIIAFFVYQFALRQGWLS